MSSKKPNKAAPIAAAKQAEVIQAASERVKGLSIDTVLETAAALRSSLNKKVDEIAQVTQSKLGDVAALDIVIAERKSTISRLAGIDAELEGYEAKKADLEAELTDLEVKKVDLERQLADEDTARAARIKREEELIALSRKQEKEAYDYNIAKARRDLEDAFRADLEKRKREETLRREDWERLLNREKNDHEAWLASGNIEKIRKEMEDGFTLQLTTSLNALRSDLTDKAKDAARLAASQLDSVKSQLDSSNAQLKAANLELERLRLENAAAGARIESIAVKAVEGAASREGFANRVVETALQQPTVQPRTTR
jgi:hypothetical protein